MLDRVLTLQYFCEISRGTVDRPKPRSATRGRGRRKMEVMLRSRASCRISIALRRRAKGIGLFLPVVDKRATVGWGHGKPCVTSFALVGLAIRAKTESLKSRSVHTRISVLHLLVKLLSIVFV